MVSKIVWLCKYLLSPLMIKKKSEFSNSGSSLVVCSTSPANKSNSGFCIPSVFGWKEVWFANRLNSILSSSWINP